MWLSTAGLNECEPVFNPKDSAKNAKLVIKQDAVLKQHPTLRRHKMKAAFFAESG
jgi:aminopeptidase N